MSELEITLKEMERRAWRSFYQDGLWDIFLGLLLVAMAVSTYLGGTDLSDPLQTGIYIGLEILAGVVMWSGKRLITAPRLGRVNFGAERKKNKSIVRAVLIASVLLGLAALVVFIGAKQSGGKGLTIGPYFMPVVWLTNCLLVFGAMAYFLEYHRLYIIGVLYGLTVPIAYTLDQVWGIDAEHWVFSVPAVIVLAMGITVLIRFLRDYPRADTDQPLEGG